jgi:hypothetical protein
MNRRLMEALALTEAATGWSGRTVACSPSVMPGSMVRRGLQGFPGSPPARRPNPSSGHRAARVLARHTPGVRSRFGQRLVIIHNDFHRAAMTESDLGGVLWSLEMRPQ